MSPRAACDGGQSRPDWRLPAARCALEVTLILLIAAYLWLHIGSALLKSVVAVVGLTGAVGVVMWYVNQLSLAWVRYGQTLTRKRRRKRERKRRERRRKRREESGSGGDQ
ncbi:hypothetical protein BRC92_00755 [Halobacteriales archaeon QS_4_69_31]|nr:MAG: hypothetical protein BRC92_00755 [Halobacteriales archaeon QS_4_69_31]